MPSLAGTIAHGQIISIDEAAAKKRAWRSRIMSYKNAITLKTLGMQAQMKPVRIPPVEYLPPLQDNKVWYFGNSSRYCC